MAMGTRKQREKQEDIWIAHTELASAPGHPFYQRLNELLEAEGASTSLSRAGVRSFMRRSMGRPSLTPGIYFRALLIGYFEGIGAERGIAWRLADSLALRRFVGIALDEYTPDHSTISRTRRLIDLDTHREAFGWVLGLLADRGLLKGQRIAIDATTLEANAAMRSIVRRDTGASYEEFLRGLAKASGIATPTREDLARLDRKHVAGIEETVTDKGYHSGAVVKRMKAYGVRSYIPEKKQKGQRNWAGKQAEQQAVYANRRRVRGEYGKSLLRRRGELVERSFAHCYETGGMRRCHLRGQENILKRQLIHVGAFNLSLILRKLLSAGTPRELKNHLVKLVGRILRLLGYRNGQQRFRSSRISAPVAQSVARSPTRLHRPLCRKSDPCTTGC